MGNCDSSNPTTWSKQEEEGDREILPWQVPTLPLAETPPYYRVTRGAEHLLSASENMGNMSESTRISLTPPPSFLNLSRAPLFPLAPPSRLTVVPTRTHKAKRCPGRARSPVPDLDRHRRSKPPSPPLTILWPFRLSPLLPILLPMQ